jgi:hypothetical protein
MSRQTELEEKYGKLLFEDAVAEFLRDTTKIDADNDKAIAELSDMFEYYGVERLGKGFDKLVMPSQMYIVGGIVHRFTAGLPEGAGFAEVKMENSDWQCLLVRKGSGYQPEVDALIKATEE